MNDLSFEMFYWFCALTGFGLFLVQSCLHLLGIDHGDDIHHLSTSDTGNFKWLSRQAVTGFLMLFGLTALTCQKELGWGPYATLSMAFFIGSLTLLITACLLNTAKKLQSAGAVFRIDDLIGLQAVVYQRILVGKVGKITVSFDHLSREVDAISLSTQPIASFTSVTIVGKADHQTVIVEALKEKL